MPGLGLLPGPMVLCCCCCNNRFLPLPASRGCCDALCSLRLPVLVCQGLLVPHPTTPLFSLGEFGPYLPCLSQSFQLPRSPCTACCLFRFPAARLTGIVHSATGHSPVLFRQQHVPPPSSPVPVPETPTPHSLPALAKSNTSSSSSHTSSPTGASRRRSSYPGAMPALSSTACPSLHSVHPLTTVLLSPQALYGSIKNEKLQWAM